jgi:hypothetical protein
MTTHLRFLGDIVRKTGEQTLIKTEHEKTLRRRELGEAFGLFAVPRVVGFWPDEHQHRDLGFLRISSRFGQFYPRVLTNMLTRASQKPGSSIQTRESVDGCDQFLVLSMCICLSNSRG